MYCVYNRDIHKPFMIKKYHRHPLNKFLQFYTRALWFFETKWENENTFSKIKERKRKNREHIKNREKVGNKRGGRKIKERKRKIKRGKKELFE